MTQNACRGYACGPAVPAGCFDVRESRWSWPMRHCRWRWRSIASPGRCAGCSPGRCRRGCAAADLYDRGCCSYRTPNGMSLGEATAGRPVVGRPGRSLAALPVGLRQPGWVRIVACARGTRSGRRLPITADASGCCWAHQVLVEAGCWPEGQVYCWSAWFLRQHDGRRRWPVRDERRGAHSQHQPP